MLTPKQLTLPGTTVRKSNEIVRARMRLDNVYAARVFTSVISCIKDSDQDFQEYTLPVSAFVDPNDKGGRPYKLVKKALESITSYAVELRLSDDEDEPDYAFIPLFAYAEYRKGNVTVQVHPKLKPHFVQLATHFTSYNLLEYLRLSGTYSQRLFEILNSYQKTHVSKEIPLNELQVMLNTPDSLNRYQDFKRYVLERAHKEIVERTDLDYEWKPIKKGNQVIAIDFVFSKKALAEAQKKNADKERVKQHKNIGKALECFKEKGGKPFLINGKCPDVKPKTTKCMACKQMGYFAV
jgi:plasmid replication initiation protein